ncbi:hypothetical protein ACFQE8_17825 [Salinirubellus sp. GCM10025818]|uniref:hypothetical protein n=1 Tax=Salinirubellus TaxID=2162630 RepID=UPI0030CC5251
MDGTSETNSLEVRWFGTGAPPGELDEWIAALGSVDTSTRTDSYLSPFGPSLNVKRRGGESIEVKRRLGELGRHDLAPGVAGNVEQWYKWSFPLDRAPDPTSADRTGLWLPIEKTRTLYALDGAEIGSLAGNVSGPTTAEVEVTEGRTVSETAWTCCLEVAGRPDDLESVFDAVAAELFGADFPVELEPDESFGYPEWLRRVTANTGPSPEILVPSNQ